MNRFVDSLDHPVVFLALITLGVIAMSSLFLWGAQKANLAPVQTLITHQPAA